MPGMPVVKCESEFRAQRIRAAELGRGAPEAAAGTPAEREPFSGKPGTWTPAVALPAPAAFDHA